MADLTGGIRRAVAPERPSGNKAPSTAGLNAGDPSLVVQEPVKQMPVNAPAFPKSDGAHKSNGWHELTDVEVRAYTETMAAVNLAAGGTLTLDPVRCQIWRVAVTGATTIVIPKPTFPSPVNPRQDAPERKRTWSCVLIVSVPSGGSFPTITGAKWSEKASTPNVKNPDGSMPVDMSGRYVFTFVYDPIADEVLGFEGGLRI